jgi:hypothetical protein
MEKYRTFTSTLCLNVMVSTTCSLKWAYELEHEIPVSQSSVSLCQYTLAEKRIFENPLYFQVQL